MAKKDTTPGTDLERINPVAVAVAVEDAGAGLKDMTQEDLAVPFLTILQALSPQVQEDSGRAIPGARPGMILNTVSQEAMDGRTKGIMFVPAHHEQQFIEWIPRDSGGGLVKIYAPGDDFVREARRKSNSRFGKIELDNGNDLAESFRVFGLVVDEDGFTEPAIIPFASTQIKFYKRWMTKARSIKARTADGRMVMPPLYAHRYRLKTVADENKKGKFYSWQITFDGPSADACRLAPDDPIYQEAKAFRDLVIGGSVRVANETLSNDVDDAPVGASGDTNTNF